MAKLYVGNLSFETTDDGLQRLFVSNGFQVASSRVIRDMDSGRSVKALPIRIPPALTPWPASLADGLIRGSASLLSQWFVR